MKSSVPSFATKEWLERNVLAGNGEVRECQRRTKPWTAARSAGPATGVVRKVFRAESGLHVAVMSGCVRKAKYEAPGYVRDYAYVLDMSDDVIPGSVAVPLFTCDAATGVWHALVLFRRRGGAR